MKLNILQMSTATVVMTALYFHFQSQTSLIVCPPLDPALNRIYMGRVLSRIFLRADGTTSKALIELNHSEEQGMWGTREDTYTLRGNMVPLKSGL